MSKEFIPSSINKKNINKINNTNINSTNNISNNLLNSNNSSNLPSFHDSTIGMTSSSSSFPGEINQSIVSIVIDKDTNIRHKTRLDPRTTQTLTRYRCI
jgi:hypothetical protein